MDIEKQMATTRKIGDLQQSDANLNERFSFLDIPRVAVEAANIGTWVLDSESRILLASNRMKELFGYYPEEKMSLDAAIAQISDKHRQKVVTAIEQAFAKNETFQIEYPIVGLHDEQVRWVSFWGGFFTPEGNAHYFSGVIMDITERKHNDLRKSKFIGMISHELKTPLTALKAYVQMLADWAKKQKDHFSVSGLSKVEKQVKKMTAMINGFLNLSSVESGHIQLNKDSFPINEMIREVIEETQFITANNNIIQVPCETVIVFADRDKLEQVLINLLNNAVKYSEKGVAIIIKCEQEENLVKVSVEDHGMGIIEENIPKLFQPHYRVESKATEKIPGFGIGLYLCSEIIKSHHGQMSVASTIGKGSTFSFAIPLI